MLGKEISNVLEPYSEHFLGVKAAGADFKLEIGQSVIINTLTVEAQALNPSISGHWFAISLYEEKHYEVFDSLGGNKSIFKQYISESNAFVTYNSQALQGLKSTNCGKYVACYVALRWNNSDLDFYSLMSLMKFTLNTTSNDHQINKLFRSLF
jgi:hypothetical protein